MANVATLGASLLTLASCAQTMDDPPTGGTTWRFDRLTTLGGVPIRVEGDPRVIESPLGRAVAFDGIDDAVFVDTHPLAGAKTFSIEAVFRPDGGAFEQRWLHLAEAAASPAPGASPPVDPSGTRILFEIRVKDDRWYLDAFATGPGYRQALIDPQKTFPVGRWYHVAQVYDGRTYRAYVDGVLQAEAEIAFQPQGSGYASVGTRINRRDYFKGAVLTARFTPRALGPADFLRAGTRR
jgi:hypothetical protein